jgi:hypothetical protein
MVISERSRQKALSAKRFRATERASAPLSSRKSTPLEDFDANVDDKPAAPTIASPVVRLRIDSMSILVGSNSRGRARPDARR